MGRFTQYQPDSDYTSMEQMIASMVAPYDFPVAFNVPIGHVDHNIPIPCSLTATLDVTPTGATVRWSDDS